MIFREFEYPISNYYLVKDVMNFCRGHFYDSDYFKIIPFQYLVHMYVEYFNKPHFFLPQFYNFRVWFLSALEKFREFKLQILKDKVVKNFIQSDYKILTFEMRQMVLNYETHSCNELFRFNFYIILPVVK